MSEHDLNDVERDAIREQTHELIKSITYKSEIEVHCSIWGDDRSDYGETVPPMPLTIHISSHFNNIGDKAIEWPLQAAILDHIDEEGCAGLAVQYRQLIAAIEEHLQSKGL